MTYDPEAVIRSARERERIAIEMRRAGMTYLKIGERMGITASRARQIVSKGERIEQFRRQGFVGVKIEKPGTIAEILRIAEEVELELDNIPRQRRQRVVNPFGFSPEKSG